MARTNPELATRGNQAIVAPGKCPLKLRRRPAAARISRMLCLMAAHLPSNALDRDGKWSYIYAVELSLARRFVSWLPPGKPELIAARRAPGAAGNRSWL